MSIPNTLTIYINTNIPGRQFIKYSPSMTIRQIKSTTIYFDPLIKLSQNIIDKTLPKEKILQFFDINLFKSLILRSETFEPTKNIVEATDEGIIDNNIQVTLNNLFKSNNIFYINNQPYTIFANNWEKGNWKIDKKTIPINHYYNYQRKMGKLTYQKINQNQMQRGKKQLESLPLEVRQGTNFDPDIVYPLTKLKGGNKNIGYNLYANLNIGYYIIIGLDLYPGNYIPTDAKYKMACNTSFINLKKSWAELLGINNKPVTNSTKKINSDKYRNYKHTLIPRSNITRRNTTRRNITRRNTFPTRRNTFPTRRNTFPTRRNTFRRRNMNYNY
jgi:hypothetical protein